MSSRRVLLVVALLLVAGCAQSFTVYHSQTGEPIILGLRAASYEGCLSTMREEAERLGVTFRRVHVRGSTVGRNLLWPFEKGYACEAAVGPEGRPNGIYLNAPPRTPQS
jgi:hypothetical protein